MAQYIPWVLSVIAICVSLYLGFHKENTDKNEKETKENKDLSVAFAKMDVKQDTILNSVNEIRLDQKNQSQKIAEIEKDLILVKESTKSAHHRIDDLICNFELKEKKENN